MSIGTYLGLTEGKTGAHAADAEKKTTRRLVATVGAGTVATAVSMALLWAPSASASEFPDMPDSVDSYEGPTVNVQSNPGTGGILFRDTNKAVNGMMSEADEATILGCHPSDPTLAWAVQVTSGHLKGEGTKFKNGWGVSAGYIKYQHTTPTEQGGVYPCGG